jgi:hypothetical protein
MHGFFIRKNPGYPVIFHGFMVPKKQSNDWIFLDSPKRTRWLNHRNNAGDFSETLGFPPLRKYGTSLGFVGNFDMIYHLTDETRNKKGFMKLYETVPCGSLTLAMENHNHNSKRWLHGFTFQKQGISRWQADCLAG